MWQTNTKHLHVNRSAGNAWVPGKVTLSHVQTGFPHNRVHVGRHAYFGYLS